MKVLNKLTGLLITLGLTTGLLHAQENFRVWPYLQHPGSEAMTILWYSDSGTPGSLKYWKQGTPLVITLESIPELAEALVYSTWEDTTFFDGEAPSAPFRHRVRIESLDEGTIYAYEVTQGSETFRSTFRTAPAGNEAIRFAVYGDCETEPESTGNYTQWPDPASDSSRIYLVDQTTGYMNNLAVIRSRQPDLVLIAGDLTQHGGEQRDWDEFWIRNTNSADSLSLAGHVPLIAAPGNHDYYEGTSLDGFNQPGSERAIRRYLTYFETPANHSPNLEQEGRYYSFNYGPATFIVLDLCNNGSNESDEDTNFYLLGESDPGGGNAPDFGIGSDQYVWLENQLIEAQASSVFTFVMFHHLPYSSGPHGFLPGVGDLLDNQSGAPARLLTPLFMKYGVDAVFCGHDEMWERSELSGIEILPDTSEVPHILSFFDVGVGGDGLRGPVEGTDNGYQQFLAHTDAPEVWEGNILVSGGKHYGHLEVDILPVGEFAWNAILTPVYILPLFVEEDSAYRDFKRMEYDDRLILTRTLEDTTVQIYRQPAPIFHVRQYPNPFVSHTAIELYLSRPGYVRATLLDMLGKQIRILQEGNCPAGSQTIVWDGTDSYGKRVAPGTYFYQIVSGEGEQLSGKLVLVNSGAI